MSYDIYCYRSTLGRPDEDEWDAVIEADTAKGSQKNSDPATKLALVKTLTAFNPLLEAFDFNYGAIARLTESTIEEAKEKFDHIELNPPEGDPAIQLTVYDNHVFITVPYWYQDDAATEVFTTLKSYIRVIHDTAGYFVYDPQTGQTFDPSAADLEGLNKYLSVTEYLQENVLAGNEAPPAKKPWWKVW